MDEVNDLANTLMTLGGLLLLGLATDTLGRRSRLPRVTLLLIFGCIIGPTGFNLIPQFSEKWFSGVSVFALLMVGFLLGGNLTLVTLRRYGRPVLWLSIMVVLGTMLTTVTGFMALGYSTTLGLILAGIATATDPAATTDVVYESKADGPFSRVLLGIVAIDDAWGLIVFSILMAIAGGLADQQQTTPLIYSFLWEIGGAILVGTVIGVPMSFLTGRIKKGEPTQAEALGLVFLCGGIAMWLEVSYLLAAMTMGAIVVNLAHHHKRPFHAIERIEWPFLILFFVLAGSSLELASLGNVGVVGVCFIMFRFVGRLMGAWIGAVISKSAILFRRWMGLALMPQAGVAMGMALVAVQKFPEMKEVIIPVVIGATVIFEMIGPVLTKTALIHVGEVKQISE